MQNPVNQGRGLGGYSDSVKVTLIKISSGMISSYEIKEKELEELDKLEKIKDEIISQRAKLLEKNNKKEISPTEFAKQDSIYSTAINDCNFKLEEMKRQIDAKNYKKARIELIQKILALDLEHTLSLMEKYDLNDKLYTSLCESIKEEALVRLNHDINMVRLKKYKIVSTNADDRTDAQNKLLDTYTNLLYELQNERDMVKKLQQINSMGDIRALKYDMLADDDITRVIHKVFPEELYTSKKRAV